MKNIEEQFQNLKNAAESAGPAPQVAAASLSFVAPTEVVDLPSRGLFYPENHPLRGKQSLEIKQMTAKEEDILTNKSFIKKGIVIDKMIESLLTDKALPVNTLLVGDKNAIMVSARINAYGPLYDVSVTCLDCGSKNLIGIDLREITVKDVEKINSIVESNPSLKHERLGNGNITFALPKSGWNVTCRLFNGEDERKLMAFLESKKKLNSDNNEIALSEQLYFIIDSINGVVDRNTIKDAIGLMPAYDAKFLRTTYAKLIPNVTIEKKYTCSSCNGEQELEVPFTQEFFWPK